MKKAILLIVLVTSAVIFSSCEKTDVDSQKPVIRLISPADEEAIKPGSSVHFEAELSDNVSLASYKVNIHGAFDGHTHSVVTRAETDVLAFEKTWIEADFVKLGEQPVKGKKNATLHHHHIQIPENINGKPIKEGHYHFTIYCTDEAGNESFVAHEIEISYSAAAHSEH